MANRAAKGSVFEREICTQLSLWWTGGARTDIFWRTAGSGARATTRAKSGQTTANHYGDLCAIDPIGQPFVDFFTCEAKRGYNKHTLHDLLDCGPRHKLPVFGDHILKAIKSHKAAGTQAWLLITRRDRRTTWVWWTPIPDLQVAPHLRARIHHRAFPNGRLLLHGMPLDEFLEEVTPTTICTALRWQKQKHATLTG